MVHENPEKVMKLYKVRQAPFIFQILNTQPRFRKVLLKQFVKNELKLIPVDFNLVRMYNSRSWQNIV